jgi:ADP-ribose pyrophosphatase YjhB (NUDIX family)
MATDGQTPTSASTPVPPPVPEVCVGAVVVADDRLLLIERGRGAAVGQWSVPGGRVEPGETMAAAVEREVLEETGMTVRCGDFLGWVERISANYHFVIMDFRADLVGSNAAVAGDDAADVAWVELSELDRYDLVDGLQAFLDEHGVTNGD